MLRFSLHLVLFMFLVIPHGCKGQSSGFDFSVSKYCIVSNGDKESAEVADYLYMHLSKRIHMKNDLQVRRSDNSDLSRVENVIYMELVPDLLYDYEVRNEAHKLSLFVREKSTAKWLTYMLIDRLASFHRSVKVTDLPPSYIDFSTDTVRFSLSYREPHLMPNLEDDYSGIIATNSIDRDWGLWGHNMQQVFDAYPAVTSQALVNGKRVKNQYCFSSESTFSAVSSFVIDQHGVGDLDPKKFMIAPNDNNLVCNCSTCMKSGNTKSSATGAVSDLLNRLGAKFPTHAFFTTAYRTTLMAPQVALSKNTGVFVSTIDLPKNNRLDLKRKEVQQFITILKAWKQKSHQLYLWDYGSNFEDYLTPFPVLFRVKAQLPFFIEQGVTGVFLNGSGYDYSPFDDVKTYVLAALMIDPTLDIPDLVQRFYTRFYPVTGTLLASYYLGLEANSAAEVQDISIYTPFRHAIISYLDTAKFSRFYEDIQKKAGRARDVEKQKLVQLLTALSYSYLQVCYHQGISRTHLVSEGSQLFKFDTKMEKALETLAHYPKFSGLTRYKEVEGELSVYLKEWLRWKEIGGVTGQQFSLQVRSTATGEPLEEATLLHDRMLGFTSDFNQGWFLAGEAITVDLSNIQASDSSTFSMRFLIHEQHRMLSPESVTIYKNDLLVKTYNKDHFRYQDNVANLSFTIPMNQRDKLQLRIKKNKKINNSVIACDEIQLR